MGRRLLLALLSRWMGGWLAALMTACLPRLGRGHSGAVKTVAWSPDEKQVGHRQAGHRQAAHLVNLSFVHA